MAYEVDVTVNGAIFTGSAASYARADEVARALNGQIYDVETVTTVTRTPVRDTRMPVGDLPGWRQIATQDFTTPVPVGGFVPMGGGYLSTSCAAYSAYGQRNAGELRVYPNGGGTGNKGWYNAPQTLSVRDDVAGADGVLDIHCQWGTIPGQTAMRGMGAAFWFPGSDNRWRKGPYYRAEYRARSTGWNVAGTTKYGAAGPFIDDQTWPKGGELDYIEVDLAPTSRVGGFHHHADPTFTNNNWTQEAFVAPPGVVVGDWHIYAIEWLPGLVRYLCDGAVVFETTKKCPSGTMPFVIQCSSHGTEPDPATEGHLQVDWVTLYSYTP